MKALLSLIVVLTLGFGISNAQGTTKTENVKEVKSVKSVKAVNSSKATLQMKEPTKVKTSTTEVKQDAGLKKSEEVDVKVSDSKKNAKVVVTKGSDEAVETTTVKVKKKKGKVTIQSK